VDGVIHIYIYIHIYIMLYHVLSVYVWGLIIMKHWNGDRYWEYSGMLMGC
jgi:hypothetical protein